MPGCIFCDIGGERTDSEVLFRDDQCFVIRDINPEAPTHLLILPLAHVTALADLGRDGEASIGHLFAVAEEMARREAVALSGFRLVINQGPDSGQGLPHLHVHLLGGKPLPGLG